MVFCNMVMMLCYKHNIIVTILILIDGFLQFKISKKYQISMDSHNPYFNRWFSAINNVDLFKKLLKYCHNPYFNRWFSAMIMLFLKTFI